MRGSLQQKISPPTPNYQIYRGENAQKSQKSEKDRVNLDFASLLERSQQEKSKERELISKGDLSTARGEKELLNLLQQQTQKSDKPKNQLDKNDFLKLFVAGLQHQDPFKPRDSAEMASNLANFNSLEQMMNVNSSIVRLQDIMRESKGVEQLNYLGKQVLTDIARLAVEDGKILNNLTFDVSKNAANVRVKLSDESGKMLKTIDLGPHKPGNYQLEWKATPEDKSPLINGVYQVEVLGKDYNQLNVPIDIKNTLAITGVYTQEQPTVFSTEVGRILASNIKMIQ